MLDHIRQLQECMFVSITWSCVTILGCCPRLFTRAWWRRRTTRTCPHTASSTRSSLISCRRCRFLSLMTASRLPRSGTYYRVVVICWVREIIGSFRGGGATSDFGLHTQKRPVDKWPRKMYHTIPAAKACLPNLVFVNRASCRRWWSVK